MQMLFYVLVLVAQYLISAAMKKKQEPPPPAAYEDFKFPQFQDGTAKVIVFGDCWVSDWMVLSVSSYRYVPITHDAGKK